MDLAFELHDLVRTLDRWAERALRPEGLGYTRYVALVILSEHSGLTGRELARALAVSEPAASAVVRALLEAVLIRDVRTVGSGNVRRLTLTDLGQQKLQVCSRLLGDSLDRNALAIGVDPHALALTIRRLHDEVRATGRSRPTDRRTEDAQ